MDYLTRFAFICFLLCFTAINLHGNQLDRIAVIVNDGVVLESDIQLKII